MPYLLAVLVLIGLAAPVFGDAPPERIMETAPARDLRIDGRLEPAWLAGACADSFVQRQPAEGWPGSLPTRAYVLYDRDALLVAFLCLDTAPDSIRGRVQRRDNDARSDAVQLILDTFHDRRNSYYFTVTASGVQCDGTVTNETVVDAAWDGIWQSAVERTDSGWAAELRIPFASIRHGGAREDGWGINLNRYIERRQEDMFWQPVSQERGFRVSEMGAVRGLRQIGSARHLELLPHAVGRWDAPAKGQWGSRNDWENLGGHVKLVPGPDWSVDLAYQPDFAQVDVDDEVINLSDYPVQLTEKRPFFLEAKSLFDNAPVMLLYTRRITDPDYGGRVNIQRERAAASVLAARDRDETGAARNVAAQRSVWNVGRLSSLGLSATLLQHRDFHSAAASADARIRWGTRNRLILAAAGVDRTGFDRQPFEGYAGMFYDFGLMAAEISTNYRGPDYNINDLGWDTYTNIFSQRVYLIKEWFPRGSFLQRIGFDSNNRRRSFADGSHVEGVGNLELYATTRSDWTLGAGSEWGSNYRRNYWAAERPYRDNFGAFRPEFHPTWYRWAWLQTNRRLPVELYALANVSTLQEGHFWSLMPEAQLKLRANLDLTGGLIWQRVWGVAEYYDGRSTDLRLWKFKLHYSPVLPVTLRGTVQWDEGGKSASTNLLLAWNWRAGSWLYIVFDEAGRTTNPVMYTHPGDRTLRLKWTYYFTLP